ncbi:MAG: lipid-A-disaccharide synthase [Pseudomonadota bacterium]
MRAFFIAGEASGDKLGSALLAGLREARPDLEVAGIGGPLMAAEGVRSLFPMSDLSVMGLVEVLPRLRHLFQRRDEAVAAAVAFDPDVLITIDSPDFCLRVAKGVRAQRPDIPVIHYVAPSVWAWRPKRAQKMARHVDHVLALLPMEPPLMKAAGVSCDFVGHPIVAEPIPCAEEVETFARKAPLITVLPGSRSGEVARLGPVFGEALRYIMARHPDIEVVLPVVANVREAVETLVADWPVKVQLLDRSAQSPAEAEARKRAAFMASDVALAASGTVALELARAGTPMVIAYKTAPFTAAIMRRLMLTPFVSLPNILRQEPLVPELLQEACTPEAIAEEVLALLDNPDRAERQRAGFASVLDDLGRAGLPPGVRAAQSVLSFLERFSLRQSG